MRALKRAHSSLQPRRPMVDGSSVPLLNPGIRRQTRGVELRLRLAVRLGEVSRAVPIVWAPVTPLGKHDFLTPQAVAVHEPG